jgi:hypothetical protein
VRRTWVGVAGLGAPVVLAVALIAVELSRGAASTRPSSESFSTGSTAPLVSSA